MQPTIKEDSPPYVMFERESVEDRAATIAAGTVQYKDIDMAYITPAGSKDRIPKIVSEWFDMLKQQVQEQRFPASWLKEYKAAYEAWKEGKEIPVKGTPLLTWPVLSKAQILSLTNLHLRTVEELSTANEETLQRIGMGGRNLKQMAVDYLAMGADRGQVIGELSASRVSLEAALAANKELTQQVAFLAQQVKNLQQSVGGQQPQNLSPAERVVPNTLAEDSIQL